MIPAHLLKIGMSLPTPLKLGCLDPLSVEYLNYLTQVLGLCLEGETDTRLLFALPYKRAALAPLLRFQCQLRWCAHSRLMKIETVVYCHNCLRIDFIYRDLAFFLMWHNSLLLDSNLWWQEVNDGNLLKIDYWDILIEGFWWSLSWTMISYPGDLVFYSCITHIENASLIVVKAQYFGIPLPRESCEHGNQALYELLV